ncbi:MmgE/PrpD family protein [Pigmentiphaga kullae]|uniref:2-methylcitrate dehydratase PrpD n=1 Tax=Pigmentiphaga kullae TaxID=151784 RepID=A0A4Q7NN70_9BURK|nr:MmgE/PrpD family protein [Pigmentiphaga kullae]RZS86659.1 2-methylcitrate dehydratase PrpD [Pigmentiphaga kullae]
MSAIRTLANHAAEYVHSSLDAEVVHHAKRAVIDWYASLFPGLATPPVRMLERVLADDLGRGRARIAGGRAATPRAAALYLGTAAHAAEIDDSFRDAMYHPGAATIAAAHAASTSVGASGLDFLRSVVLGYELSTRIGVILGRDHYKYWHSTGTVGGFGAAGAAGSAFKLDADRFSHALATVGTFAAGLQQAFRSDSMSKPFHAGRAAEAGLFAAQLAAEGVTGSESILDGDAGIGVAMSANPDWSAIGQSLGREFHITRLTFKNHIGCGHTFAAIDAALALRERFQRQAEEIVSVSVSTYRPAVDIACYMNPSTENEAKFSLRFVVATALVHGSVRLAAYDPARLRDPQVRALMEKIEVHVDDELDRNFPGKRSARVRLTTSQGTVIEHYQADRKGDPECPLSDSELSEKFIELASPALGDRGARTLLEELWSLENREAAPRIG